MFFEKYASDLFKKLDHLRHHLHRYPELSGKAVKTAAFITQILEGLSPSDLITEVGGTGALAVFDSCHPGQAILFRTELDALPIQETNAFSYANENDEQAVELVRHSARKLDLSIREMETPIKWGEDFGLFTQRFPGALFGLGAGENTPALHNPDYDFPDDLIPTGVNIFSSIIGQLLR